MQDRPVSDISEIEDAQAALRESIEATKALAERAEDLLRKHKVRVERAEAGGDRDPADSPPA